VSWMPFHHFLAAPALSISAAFCRAAARHSAFAFCRGGYKWRG
jgi:hypothetical protein